MRRRKPNSAGRQKLAIFICTLYTIYNELKGTCVCVCVVTIKYVYMYMKCSEKGFVVVVVAYRRFESLCNCCCAFIITNARMAYVCVASVYAMSIGIKFYNIIIHIWAAAAHAWPQVHINVPSPSSPHTEKSKFNLIKLFQTVLPYTMNIRRYARPSAILRARRQTTIIRKCTITQPFKPFCIFYVRRRRRARIRREQFNKHPMEF